MELFRIPNPESGIGERLTPVIARPKAMSLATLVYGRGNPVYLLQSPDVRGASQGRRKRSAGLLRAQRPSMRNALGARKDGRIIRSALAKMGEGARHGGSTN